MFRSSRRQVPWKLSWNTMTLDKMCKRVLCEFDKHHVSTHQFPRASNSSHLQHQDIRGWRDGKVYSQDAAPHVGQVASCCTIEFLKLVKLFCESLRVHLSMPLSHLSRSCQAKWTPYLFKTTNDDDSIAFAGSAIRSGKVYSTDCCSVYSIHSTSGASCCVSHLLSGHERTSGETQKTNASHEAIFRTIKSSVIATAFKISTLYEGHHTTTLPDP